MIEGTKLGRSPLFFRFAFLTGMTLLDCRNEDYGPTNPINPAVTNGTWIALEHRAPANRPQRFGLTSFGCYGRNSVRSKILVKIGDFHYISARHQVFIGLFYGPVQKLLTISPYISSVSQGLKLSSLLAFPAQY